jgi:hypothetical protein
MGRPGIEHALIGSHLASSANLELGTNLARRLGGEECLRRRWRAMSEEADSACRRRLVQPRNMGGWSLANHSSQSCYAAEAVPCPEEGIGDGARAGLPTLRQFQQHDFGLCYEAVCFDALLN